MSEPVETEPPFEWGAHLPTLQTPRLALRHLRPTDAADVFAVFSDPEVMRYWDHGPMTALEEASSYIADIDGHFRRRELFQWGTTDRLTDRVVGTCTLWRVSTPHQRGEIGFALGQAHWGRGLGREAITALIGFAFDTLRLHRLEADTDPRNDRSLRLLEGLGFQRDGYLKERYHVGGARQDAVLLSLLRPDWRR